MELHKPTVELSLGAYASVQAAGGLHYQCVRAAIETYLKNAPITNGDRFVGEPVASQRDYRKELWLAEHSRGASSAECKYAVQQFDGFFGESK